MNANYWMKIGFDSKLANRLEKFIKSGFELKDITDLKKVYGMKKEWVLLISDSVVFDSYLIDINVANAESFESINGIGTKIANRIIKFRSSLGGFYSVNQLEDVYGIDSIILAENLDKFKLLTSHQKIKINKVGLNNMIKHPLINVFQGEEIIKIRSIYGTVDSIKVRNIFTFKEWSEIKNYLEWEN